MPLSPERLAEIVQLLASRPGHEAVHVGVAQLLTDGLGARDYEVRFEAAIPEARGIIDALVGRTIFEFKSNLRTERADAEEQLTRYLAQRELRDDFTPESDVDVLARFGPDAERSFGAFLRAQDELAAMLGRKVDLVSWQAAEESPNYYRRKAVLDSAQVIYDAA